MRWALLILVLMLGACDTARSGNLPVPAAPEVAMRNFDLAVSRVIPVATRLCQDRRPTARCDFHVVVDDRPGRAPNAFQSLGAGGQPVLTFTATLIADARNPDEIALIVAHEAAHHISGHLGRLNRKVAMMIGQASGEEAALGMAAGPDLAWNEVHAAVREFELAADGLGAQITAAAGFDPAKAARIFARLPQPPAHVSGSHPANEDRLHAVHQAKRHPL